jgi:hypothetical protein
MDEGIKDFLRYDYKEAKDLATSFLTLVSAILVGTVTFSEKIVDFQRAPAFQRSLVIGSWVAFVFAIISSGIAVIFDYNSVLAARRCGGIDHTCDPSKDALIGLLPFLPKTAHQLLEWGNWTIRFGNLRGTTTVPVMPGPNTGSHRRLHAGA